MPAKLLKTLSTFRSMLEALPVMLNKLKIKKNKKKMILRIVSFYITCFRLCFVCFLFKPHASGVTKMTCTRSFWLCQCPKLMHVYYKYIYLFPSHFSKTAQYSPCHVTCVNNEDSEFKPSKNTSNMHRVVRTCFTRLSCSSLRHAVT